MEPGDLWMSLWYMYYRADPAGTDIVYNLSVSLRHWVSSASGMRCRCWWIFSLVEGFVPLAAISENWEFLFLLFVLGGFFFVFVFVFFWPEITLQQKQRKHFSYKRLTDTSFLAYCLLENAPTLWISQSSCLIPPVVHSWVHWCSPHISSVHLCFQSQFGTLRYLSGFYLLWAGAWLVLLFQATVVWIPTSALTHGLHTVAQISAAAIQIEGQGPHKDMGSSLPPSKAQHAHHPLPHLCLICFCSIPLSLLSLPGPAASVPAQYMATNSVLRDSLALPRC